MPCGEIGDVPLGVCDDEVAENLPHRPVRESSSEIAHP